MEVTFRVTKKPDKKSPKPLTFSWRRPGLLGVLGVPWVSSVQVESERLASATWRLIPRRRTQRRDTD